MTMKLSLRGWQTTTSKILEQIRLVICMTPMEVNKLIDELVDRLFEAGMSLESTEVVVAMMCVPEDLEEMVMWTRKNPNATIKEQLTEARRIMKKSSLYRWQIVH